MSKTLIKVDQLSKKYTIGKASSGSLYQTLGNLWKSKSAKEEDFWALKEVSFDVKEGDTLGVIGKNGAGKSTLLKVLSRITEPTSGRIEINGRVASLLEVGTGFHPELTGRENIFLNGSILGMRRQEIKSKFDEIVDFSGVEKFIDTPVKHYSSGMYVRLAFSVAAHLESDVLIVDEVLAVGDLDFQKKCLGKMETVTKDGKAIIFVSHNISAIKNLCTECLHINNGMIVKQGKVDDVINHYLKVDNDKSFNRIILIGKDVDNRHNNSKLDLFFTEITLNKTTFLPNDEIILKLFCGRKDKKSYDVIVALAILDQFNNCLYHLSSEFLLSKQTTCDNETKYYQFSIPTIALKEGQYKITIFLSSDNLIQDWITDIARFNVIKGNVYGNTFNSDIKGLVQPQFNFKIIQN